MSHTAKVCQVLLDANAPMSAAAIAAAAGLDASAVSALLYPLEQCGAIERVADSRPILYQVKDQEAVRRRTQGRRAPPAGTEPKHRKAAGRASKKATKEKPKKEAKKAPPRRPRAPAGPRYQFFVDDDGDLQIALRDGSAEPLMIPRKEAERLADFLDRTLGGIGYDE